MRVGWYPGCASKSFRLADQEALKRLLGRLGYELFEIRDWVCCTGGVAEEAKGDAVERITAVNLVLAASQGADLVATPCSLCLSTLTRGARRLDAGLVESVARKLGVEPPEKLPPVVHLADLLIEAGERLDTMASGRLIGLYPGCGYLAAHGPVEARRRLARLAELLGASGYRASFTCCGFPLYASRPRLAEKMASRVEEELRGVELVVTLCPLCKLSLARFTGLRVYTLEELLAPRRG